MSLNFKNVAEFEKWQRLRKPRLPPEVAQAFRPPPPVIPPARIRPTPIEPEREDWTASMIVIGGLLWAGLMWAAIWTWNHGLR